MKRFFLILSTILMLLSLLIACASNDTSSPPNLPNNSSSLDQKQTPPSNLTLNDFINAYNEALRSSVSIKINTNVSDSKYISCAKTLIGEFLKNPSSAQYNDAQVYEKDNYGRAIVYLDISAQNSFGGWVRSRYYVCIHSINSDGTFTYNSAMPYIDDESFSLYETFKAINSFNSDPIKEELSDVLVANNNYVMDSLINLSSLQTLYCYKCTKNFFSQTVYVDSQTLNIVAVQTSIIDKSDRINCARVISATASALTGCDMSVVKSTIENVFNYNSLSPSSDKPYFKNNYLYECSYKYAKVTLAITVTDSKNYNSGLYWSPINQESYYEKLADKYFEKDDFDNAITYYELSMIENDKLFAAYYAKAEQCLESGDFDMAGSYFKLAENYMDSAVRVLEVYYNTARKHEENNDFISAINSYFMAGDYLDAKAKYRECNYKQGEKHLFSKQYREALDCFEKATTYEGATEKFKESCYLYAEQQLIIGNIDTASNYFIKADDYKDASTKMSQYYYEHGNDSLTNENYLDAIDFFRKCYGYLDSNLKYKEANYLYGEKLLNNGNVESAKSFFYDATGYKDADTRVQRYYYEGGTQLLNSGDYLNAAEKFILADVYSDAKTMEKECYYQYAKKQKNLNYISNAIEYFSKCRGYKDTDDILLGYYYEEASKSVSVLLKAFSGNSLHWEVVDAHTTAKEKLILCEGYKDSNTIIKIIDKLFYAWLEMSDASAWTASLYDMVATYSGNNVTVKKEQFVGVSCDLFLEFNVENNTFTADITNIDKSYQKEVISALISLFTDIEDISDFKKAIFNKNNWLITDEEESFTMFYGGYMISVTSQQGDYYGYKDCKIMVTK